MFLSVSYHIKYQKLAHGSLQPPEKKNIPEQAAVQTHTSTSQQQPLHSTATLSSTLGVASVPKQRAVNKELSEHTHSQCSSLSECNFSKLDIL